MVVYLLADEKLNISLSYKPTKSHFESVNNKQMII